MRLALTLLALLAAAGMAAAHPVTVSLAADEGCAAEVCATLPADPPAGIACAVDADEPPTGVCGLDLEGHAQASLGVFPYDLTVTYSLHLEPIGL